MFLLLIPEKRRQMKLFQLGIKANENILSRIIGKEEKRQKHSADISVELLFNLYIIAIIVDASVINIYSRLV